MSPKGHIRQKVPWGMHGQKSKMFIAEVHKFSGWVEECLGSIKSNINQNSLVQSKRLLIKLTLVDFCH